MFRLPNAQGDIKLKNRKISRKILMKAFRIISYTVLALIISIVLIRIFEPNSITYESIIFECISAISTVGLTMGITPILSIPSKIIIALLMFVGRVGLMTIAMAIASKNMNPINDEIEYSNTDIII
jgi:trk system potassium uptake protein TrkH